ncbi:cytochrome P450 71B34-like [Humulus lupulus]|uniref:cytochrome P450 71B34-like n=1 Tax=Humulus lupulus TaxID=3486 RepID=UPI002B40BD9A|nr:cytochrome P450 71B34-like [Humulus lupulus]
MLYTMWLLLILLLPLLFLMQKKIKAKQNNTSQLPPGPSKLPIIGNIHQLGSLPHQSLWKLSKRYGDVMLLRLGRLQAIVVSSAEAAEEVLKVHDLDCCSRPPLAGLAKLSYNNHDISFSPYSEHWRQIRKVCVLKLFSIKSVQSFQFVREEEIDSLICFLKDSSTTPVNLSEKMYSLTASVILRTAFGKRFLECGLDNDKFEDIIHRAIAVLGSLTASDLFPYVGWIIDRLTGLHARFERSFHELDDFFCRVIDEHLKRSPKEGKEDIVDLLLCMERSKSDYGDFQFTRDCTKAVLMDIFLAGVDTGAVTLTWAMSELAKNPTVMKKVQNEVRSLKNGKITESDIHQLQYLKMVVKETLRLHPALPLLVPREIMSRFKLANYDVSPKTLIQVNVWAIGRDPKYWQNPEEFFPERFIDSFIDYKGQHFELLPFGAGRRGCPGMYSAMTMVELTLANLLTCFDWKLPDGIRESDIDMEEAAGLTTHKNTALKLVPVTYQWPSKDQI